MTFDLFNTLLLLAVAVLVLNLRRASFKASAAIAYQQAAQAARHAELLHALAGLREDMEEAESRQMQRNADHLAGVLREVISDLQQRVVAGFEAHLANLTAIAARTAESSAKHRSEQMEAMHHARRVAGQMDQATREFRALLADSATLAQLAGEISASLDLLGPRQEATDSGMAKQLETLQAMAGAVAALRPELEEIGEQLASQIRRAFDAMAQRSAQSASALSKELAETLGKATTGITKQLSGIVPLAQQAKRGAEAARMLR